MMLVVMQILRDGIDEVVIWNEELDTTQIAALATGLARPGVTSGYSRYIQTSLESELFARVPLFTYASHFTLNNPSLQISFA